ncbi:hypothetical protein, variant [Plasmodium yoelii 17X]|uniref:Pv-fam-g protein n=1 Tax=Plasmodium yoelii 17X TaxID=1323249 RepID=V7PU86_PLAYE|nr:hypothetical protein YYC_00759 [Plasmodium yoelii 17X]ETB63179.1 hypothetical protein, variant [Plasmodium yoelii 17X]
MGIDITTKKHSSRRHKLSKNDLTFEKPILKESTTKDSCSDDEEIEFEGWVEFITKDDRCTDENDEYERAPKSIQEKRNSKIKSFIPTQKEENDFIQNKNEKVYISSRRNSNKSNIPMNDQYPRYSYISPNYFYEQPQSIVPLCNQTSYTNENKIIYPVYLSNPQECPKDGMNIIKPNYIDPPPPIVLKNTQVLPQLYIRQPPTVIVTNESRPPLVINPPPANVILKNKAPQPIYVNSTRPNIIIKNDTPSTQNPINMDTTPIQLDVMPENRENAINSSINYSSAANIKTDVNILPNSIPTNVLHLENNTNDYMASQNMPSIYMLNNNNIRPQVLYQNGLPISTINAINPDFPINNAVPNHQVHTSIPQGVQSFPQSVVHNVSQSHGSVQSPLYTVPQTMQYTNQNYQMHNNVNVQPMGYEQEVQQYRYLNTPPQVINQNYMPLHTDMRLQMRNSVIPRNGSMVPNNVVQSEAHMGKYRNHSMNKNNANIPVIHNSYNSLEKVATCGTIGCGGKPKTSPVSPLRRRSTYVNLKQDFINSPLKSVQIVSQPAINRNTRAYSTYR